MSSDKETRDRVRALVQEVLRTAVTVDESEENARQVEIQPPTQVANAADAAPLVDVRSNPVAPPTSEQPFTHDESSKNIITEIDVRHLPAGARLRIATGARLTALAAEIVHERGIELVRKSGSGRAVEEKIVAVGVDHGGYEVKSELLDLLADLKHKVRDFGTHSSEAVDYPDIAHEVARAVASGEADLGIIIDGAGIGSAMTANKVPGVRAAACYSTALARNSREHNDANVLTLGSKTNTKQELREIIQAWLNSTISEERHRKRVDKIIAVERQYTS